MLYCNHGRTRFYLIHYPNVERTNEKMIKVKSIKEPEIIEEKVIDADSVRMCCVKHNLYTKGTCRDYDFMLNFADVQGYSLKKSI